MHLMHFDFKIWLYTCMPTFTPDKVCKIEVGPKEREPHVKRLRYIEALFFQVIGGLNVVGLVQKKVCLSSFVTVGSRKY